MTPSLAPRVLVTLVGTTLVLSDTHNRLKTELPSLQSAPPRRARSLPMNWLNEIDQGNALTAALSRLDWLVPAEPQPPNPPLSLRDAILQAQVGDLGPEPIVTHNEALIFGYGSDAEERLRLLRRFVSRLDWRRLQSYAGLTWRDSDSYWTWGDIPSGEGLATIAATAQDESSRVLDLQPCGSSSSTMREAHSSGAGDSRLDIVAELDRQSVTFGCRSLWLVTGTYAQPNLAFVGDPTSPRTDHRWCMGTASDPSTAGARARGEGIERYAMGDYRVNEMIHSPAAALPDAAAVPPVRLVPYSERQRIRHGLPSYHAAASLWWVLGSSGSGTPTWLPAFAVFCPFGDEPDWLRSGYSSSSGAAAHRTTREARAAAWLELNERDAFMRQFLSGLPPSQIATPSLPSDVRDLLRHARAGYDLKDIVLVTMRSSLGLPVAACLARRPDRFAIGASCKADAQEAMTKAITEVLLQLRYPFGSEPLNAEDVVTPEDHARFYSSAATAQSLDWMFEGTAQSTDTDTWATPLSLMDSAFFYDVKDVDGLAVSRAIDPRLIPITFGHDTLPENLPPVRAVLRDPRRLLIPHPFP